MQSYMARQAIFNRRKHLVAYELLHRIDDTNAFPEMDDSEATAKLISHTQLNRGLTYLTKQKPALINFAYDDLIRLTPTLLPKDKIVIEVLESVRPTQALLNAFKQLKKLGYHIALDDFEFNPDWLPFLPYVRLIKIDIQALDSKTLAKTVALIKQYEHIALLAEKVEHHHEYAKARAMGFKFFQGYFFCQPELQQDTDVDISRAAVMRVYQLANRDDIPLKQLAASFECDTALAYKLLRFVNSGLFPVKAPIGSIYQALVYLGQSHIRRFANLIATAYVGEAKPNELLVQSISRAKFAEELAKKLATADSDNAFLMGLFSLIDAVLDRPMADILATLPLNEEINQALKGYSTPLKAILNVVCAYETGSWSKMRRATNAVGLTIEEAQPLYEQAVCFADNLEVPKSSDVPLKSDSA